ncbi:endonuclease V [Streptomyces sp. CB01881]|uniref:endonuclease V n=1 Tax=Streptomyces sp. CB01881 TaxID=2078691 RepID=UPI000CDCDFE3|nr:endonuclease V [Streptomyces sp. CB01881]AUY51579.1 endonuclease V [Streptomyces sp. CB01881]TYC74969.1 endonuclease V [Streptomyces sp. CB01881]
MPVADWPTTETEAIAEQERLRPLVQPYGPGPSGAADDRLIAGVDVAYDDERDLVVAAAVVLDLDGLAVVEEATAVDRVAFPYVPGLLAFRELPAVLDVLERLIHAPGTVVCDGYGLAHPRRLGLASHLGVLTGLRTIGVAKTPFTFDHREPGAPRGSWTPLTDPATGEEVGRAVRTRAGVKPVFVSVGHRIGLTEAVDTTLALAGRYRLPETTRHADSLCRRALAALQKGTSAN